MNEEDMDEAEVREFFREHDPVRQEWDSDLFPPSPDVRVVDPEAEAAGTEPITQTIPKPLTQMVMPTQSKCLRKVIRSHKRWAPKKTKKVKKFR